VSVITLFKYEGNELFDRNYHLVCSKNFVENTASKPIYVGSVKLEITATLFRTEEKLLSFFGKSLTLFQFTITLMKDLH